LLDGQIRGIHSYQHGVSETYRADIPGLAFLDYDPDFTYKTCPISRRSD
jgi:hypothetical protein